MKKMNIALVLGFLLAVVPVSVRATRVSSSPELGGVLAAGVATFLLLTDGSKPEAKAKTGDEFADLNNTSDFKTLLSQQAGGDKNTLDLLK